jgi:hypothetical protein
MELLIMLDGGILIRRKLLGCVMDVGRLFVLVGDEY